MIMEMKKEEKLKESSMIAYAVANSSGYQFIQAVVASYILLFFTDTFGIPAAAASAIMLTASVWDAVNDPMMGAIADRTRSRFGRYRGYLLFCPFVLTVISYLLFLNPAGLSVNAKIAWAAVFYVLYGMCVTAVQMPLAALIPAMTKKDSERNTMVQLMVFLASLCLMLVSSFTLNIEAAVGGYHNLMLIGGIVMVITFLILFQYSEEKYLTPVSRKPFMHDIKALLQIKELYPVIMVWLTGYLGFNIMMSSSVFYMMYYMCRPDLIPSYMMVLSVAGMVSVTFGISILMRVFKGSVKKCFGFSQAVTAIIYVVLFFAGGENLTVLYVLSGLAAAFATMSNAFIPMINNEMIDYVAYKNGTYMNATVSAIKGFACKCGAGLASALLGGALALGGYAAGAIGQQTEAALRGINIGRFGIPALAAIILCIALAFYPVDQVRDEITAMKGA